MSNTIQIKRSSTAASVPTAGQLAVGELAVNLADKKLFTKDASNAVVELGGAGVALTGDQTIAGVKTFSSSPVVPNATTSGQAVNKGQLDAAVAGVTSVGQLRAWVNFNGTGTVAIRASGNVSSITDHGVGDYTVNFTTALADANYSTVSTGSFANGIGCLVINQAVAPSVSGVRLVHGHFIGGGSTGYPSDVLYANVAIFR
jgi:hypothetical protein